MWREFIDPLHELSSSLGSRDTMASLLQGNVLPLVLLAHGATIFPAGESITPENRPACPMDGHMNDGFNFFARPSSIDHSSAVWALSAHRSVVALLS